MNTSTTATSTTKAPKIVKAPKATKVPGELTAAQKRSATVATKRAAKIAERGYSLPLMLTCKVTGKSVRYTSPTYIEKVIAKHGSLDALQNGFISREGRAINKAALPPKVAKVRKAKTSAVAPTTTTEASA